MRDRNQQSEHEDQMHMTKPREHEGQRQAAHETQKSTHP